MNDPYADTEAVRMVRESEARRKELFGAWLRDDPCARAEQVALFIDT